MKQIEGIELAELVKEEEDFVLKDKRAAVAKQIRGIYQNLLSWQSMEKKMERDLVKLKDKIAKAEEKLAQIKEGNWSVLQEDNKEQKPNDDDTGSG